MNTLFIMADEHAKAAMGCGGNPIVRTPNLDRLAGEGVRFANAYCNSPICVPSRASLATGRYIHQTGNWDNSAPYAGSRPSWGHRLTENGRRVITIGKLHFRDSEDPTGFPDQRLPLHVKNRVGDMYSLLREERVRKKAFREHILQAGPGEPSYIGYDRSVSKAAERFFHEEAKNIEKPWTLFVSFATPHFPLQVPEEYFEQYPPETIPLPRQYSLAERPKHPVLEAIRDAQCLSDELEDGIVRRAIAAYYGLCTFMDEQVGRVLQALQESGHRDSTRVIYASDHGDAIGHHGMWYKASMYEESVSVPFLMAGPDIPEGKVIETPISLVDVFPTILESVGVQRNEEDSDLPGSSLFSVIRGDVQYARPVFSEYHATASPTGIFMLRDGRYKLVEYAGYESQLFDLESDPEEMVDLGSDPAYRQIKQICETKLRDIADPILTDRLAKKDQLRRLEAHGGKEKVRAGGAKLSYSPVPELF